MPKPYFPETSMTLLSALRTHPFDAGAWGRFVSTYAPRILKWCRRWGLQEADAEDVTQAVLMDFLRRSRGFQYDDSRRFRGWLRSVVHTSWCELMRSRARVGWVNLGGSMIEIGSIEARDDLAEFLDREEACERLEEAMQRVRDRVEPRTWEAFWLLNMEGLPGVEAASRVGMRLGSTYAASSKVRRMIGEEMGRREAVRP